MLIQCLQAQGIQSLCEIGDYEHQKQILKCHLYKRALRAHIHTYTALYEVSLEQFFTEMAQLKEICSKPANEYQEACRKTASGTGDGAECIRIANNSPAFKS